MADDLLFALAAVSLLEVLPMHLFVNHWNATAAWVLTGLSVYGAICMMALARALTLRPTLVSAESILVRYGLLFSLRIPADRIRSIRTTGEPPQGTVVMPRGSTPSIYLEFAEPLEAETILGLHKRVSGIGLGMDDAPGFANALQALNSARVLR